MNHMELGPSTVIGAGLIIVGVLLYALKAREPHVSRGVISNVLRKNPTYL